MDCVSVCLFASVGLFAEVAKSWCVKHLIDEQMFCRKVKKVVAINEYTPPFTILIFNQCAPNLSQSFLIITSFCIRFHPWMQKVAKGSEECRKGKKGGGRGEKEGELGRTGRPDLTHPLGGPVKGGPVRGGMSR